MLYDILRSLKVYLLSDQNLTRVEKVTTCRESRGRCRVTSGTRVDHYGHAIGGVEVVVAV